MKRLHIAIFTLPGHGHVYPVLGLCPELVRRGYRVSCVATKTYERRILELDAEPILFETEIFNDEQKNRMREVYARPVSDPAWWAAYADIVYPAILSIASATLLQLKKHFIEDPPDLILYDRLAFAGRILANHLHIPTIQFYPHFAYYRNFLHRENGVCVNPEPMLHFSKSLDSFLAKHGIDGRDHLWHTEKLNIYFLPKELQYHADYFDERSCFVGPCLRNVSSIEWRDKSNGRPIILVSDISYGVDAEFFNKVVNALSEHECHVILSIGPHVNEESIRSLPPNFEINKQASHLEILPHTSLAINHAGILTSLESFYHGVPIIAAPPTPVTEEVAYRLAELRLGVHLRRDTLTAEMIRDSVDYVLRDRYIRHEVNNMNDALRRAGGARKAADTIEKFIGAS